MQVVHGDLKSVGVFDTSTAMTETHALFKDNIMISPVGEPLVCDFGLSISLRASTTGRPGRETSSNGSKGTLRWMAPELLRRGANNTFASDVWAFGMIVYVSMNILHAIFIAHSQLRLKEVYARRLPYFELHNEGQVMMALLQNELPDLLGDVTEISLVQGDISPIRELCDLCWNSIPTSRPTMADLVRHLDTIRLT